MAGAAGRRRVEQLDGQLPAAGQPGADDHQAVVVAVHLDVVAVLVRPLHARVVVEVGASRQHRTDLAAAHEQGVERPDLPARPGQPPQHLGVRCPAEPVGTGRPQLVAVDVGEDERVPGERDDRRPAGGVGWQQVDTAVGRRERAGRRGVEDGRQRVAARGARW